MDFLKKASHYFCWLVGNSLFRILFHFKVVGTENIPQEKKGLIIVFNHGSWLDPFFIFATISPLFGASPIHFATWHKHYEKFRLFTSISGAFPVKKGVGLEQTLEKGIEILKKGGVVGIAPEEKRRHLGRPRKGRRGAAFLALKTGAPLLPVFIHNNIGLTMSDIFSRKKEIIIVIGKVFSLEEAYIERPSELDEFSDLIMDKVYELEREI
jgi:1-acyl-sn-glycerol-3-phosphate acyltransferase